MTTTSTLARNLRRVRELRGLTQQDLADAIRTSQAHIREMESGKHDPRVGTVMRFLTACDYTLSLQPRRPAA